MNDADEFDKVVGSDREKLSDVEYLKTINLNQAIELAVDYKLNPNELTKFFQFYLNEVHADKTIEQLGCIKGIGY